MANLYANVLFRHQWLYHLRPLNEAEVAAVEIVLETDVVSLFQLFNTIEIKMIDLLAFLCYVFVDDSKCRAVHLIRDAHTMA